MQAQSDTFEAVVLDKIEFQITTSGFWNKAIVKSHTWVLSSYIYCCSMGQLFSDSWKNSFDSKQGLQHLCFWFESLRFLKLESQLSLYFESQSLQETGLFWATDGSDNGRFWFSGIHLYTDVTLQNKIQVLNEEVLREVSLVQQTSFNIAVNLVDPNTFWTFFIFNWWN